MHSGNFLPNSIPRRVQYYPRLARIAARLTADCALQMDLTTAAKLACMEKSAFCRFFSKATGITFVEYRRYIRVQKAVELLSSSDISVTEVSGTVGFQSICAFNKAFRAITGYTPSAYRKAVRSNLSGDQPPATDESGALADSSGSKPGKCM